LVIQGAALESCGRFPESGIIIQMKSLLWGIVLIVILGVGGLIYRNAVENPTQPIACPVISLECPDGSSVAHLVGSCDFPACPPPNVSLADSNIAFALPDGFTATTTPDAASIAAYANTSTSSNTGIIVIRRFGVDASSTPLAIIRQTAISATSGTPVPVTALSSTVIGGQNFTVVSIERFEGVVDTAYYLARGSDVLRFDAIDGNVINWADANLNIQQLPVNAALRKLLTTLQ
jgi:hypothetical protein